MTQQRVYDGLRGGRDVLNVGHSVADAKVAVAELGVLQYALICTPLGLLGCGVNVEALIRGWPLLLEKGCPTGKEEGARG